MNMVSIFVLGSPCLAQSTILKTDQVAPLTTGSAQQAFGQNFQFRLWQKLPARLYFNGYVESTLRIETNPYQTPNKYEYLRHNYPSAAQLAKMTPAQIAAANQGLATVDSFDNVDRIFPNFTVGWALTPNTRVYSSGFMIRDTLFKNFHLDTNIFSIGSGIQNTRYITKKGYIMTGFFMRELWETNIHPVFDYIPSVSYYHQFTPAMLTYVSVLTQFRGKQFMNSVNREIDPFYTFGSIYRRGRWMFINTCTFVQNFRNQFGVNALLPTNNYSFICDFEIDRQIFKAVPGLLAFVRAEPVYNMHSNDVVGLSGTDFRLYYGFRFTFAKPALNGVLQQLRQQLEEEEEEEEKSTKKKNKPPSNGPVEQKPTAYTMPYELCASRNQPMHGPLKTGLQDCNYQDDNIDSDEIADNITASPNN